MDRRGAVGAAVAILVLAGAAAWLSGTTPSGGEGAGGSSAVDRGGRAPSPPLPPPPPPVEPRLLSWSFEEGRLLAWTVNLDTDGRVDAGLLRSSALGRREAAEPPAWIEVSSRFRGTLHARFLRDGEGGWWIAARLAGDLTVNGSRSPDADLLDRVFLARAAPDGRVDRFLFAEGLPDASSGACRSVLEGMETVLPGGAAAEWTAELEDLQGTATVRCRLLPGDASPGFAVGTEKVRYLALAADLPPVEALEVRILRSSGISRHGPGSPWLASVERAEEIRFLSRGRTVGESRASLSAVACPPDPAAGPPATLAGALGSLHDPDLLRRSILSTRPDLDAVTKGWDPAAAAARFTAGYAGDYPASRDLLLNWLRQDPGRAAALARWLEVEGERLDLDPELALWGMIARCGTPESQEALAEVLLGEGWSERSRFRALAHAGDAPLPTREYTDALWEAHRRGSGTGDELRRALHATSAYALGALGGPDRVDREASLRIGGEIAAALEGARTDGDRLVLLDAAGNHGGAGLLEAVERALDSTNPVVRARAFRAFRRMEGEEAIAALIRRWRVEPLPPVRAAAMEALAAMVPSEASLAFAREALRSPLAAEECVPLVGLLGRTMQEHPDHEADLKALLARRPPQSVRKEIYRFVLPEKGEGGG